MTTYEVSDTLLVENVEYSNGADIITLNSNPIGDYTLQLPLTIGTPGQFLGLDGVGGLLGWLDPITKETRTLNYTLDGNPVESTGIILTTVDVNAGSFDYRGTNNVDPITQFKAIVSGLAVVGGNGSIIIRDRTNGNAVISSGTISGSSGRQILTLGAVSNLPTNPTVFDVIVRASSALVVMTMTLYSLTVIS